MVVVATDADADADDGRDPVGGLAGEGAVMPCGEVVA
jgi:hypothetical protein